MSLTVADGETGEVDRGEPQPAAEILEPSTERPPTWWRRPWFLFAVLICFGFIIFSWPPYLSFDPSKARLPNQPYPILVAHIIFGTIAIGTVPFQLWPWLRRRHPAVHRTMGRMYVLAMIPTGLLALTMVPFAVGPAGDAIGAILWMSTTITGWRMARQHRYAEHRKWMIYSFALCLQIIEGRFMIVLIPLIPGYKATSLPLILETASWIGVLLNLLVAYWWIERGSKRRAAKRQTAQGQLRKRQAIS